MKKHFLVSLAFFCAVFTVFISCEKDTSDFLIGAFFPLSGPVSFLGNESRDGVLLAIEKINVAGGLLGRRVSLICEDDEGNAEKAVEAFNKLLTEDEVSIFIGSSISGPTIPVTTLAQQNQVILISPSATNIAVTRAGDYIFRACFIDPFQGVVGAEFAYESLRSRRAAILYDADAAYNIGLAEAFYNHFTELGAEVVSIEVYQSGDEDFTAQIRRIRAVNPDVVYLPNYYNDVIYQVKQLRAQGVNCPLVGGDGWDGLVDIGTDEILNTFWSSGFAADTSDPWGVTFVKEFEARFNRPATQYAALGYDAMMIVADGVRNSGSFDPAEIKEAILKISRNYVTGTIRFDPDRNPIKGAVINEIVKRDGKFVDVYTRTINPK